VPALLAIALSSSFCLNAGMSARVTDAMGVQGPSISKGAPQDGTILDPAELPTTGAGYHIPATWVARQTNFGTDELVRALQIAAAHVADVYPGSLIAFGDMGKEHGGSLGAHASHESGRDVDIMYYTTDAQGNPLPPADEMIPFAPDGTARWADAKGVVRHFDAARNWEFVESVLTNPTIDVEWFFMQKDLKTLVLAYAQANGASPALLAQAQQALHQPTDSAPHDDHMHLRIACPTGDAAQGCVDFVQHHAYRKPAAKAVKKAPPKRPPRPPVARGGRKR
jgi:penicillin-insensitive murein endopeptidase